MPGGQLHRGRRVTGSSMRLARTCPASHALPQVNEAATPEMEDGKDVHAFIERTFGGDGYESALGKVPKHLYDLCSAIDFPTLQRFFAGRVPQVEVAIAYDPDTDTARVLGERMGRDYSDVRPGEIPGTLDALEVIPDPEPPGADMLVFADWKTGYSWVEAPETNDQVRFYALAGARAHKVSKVRAQVVRLDEEGTPRVFYTVFDADDLDAIAYEARKARDGIDRVAEDLRVNPLGSEVTIGSHCSKCRAVAWCPGMAPAVQTLQVWQDRQYPITPENASQAWKLKAGLTAALEWLNAGLNAYGKSGNVFPAGNGKIVREVEKRDRVVSFNKLLEVAARPEFDCAAELLKEAKVTEKVLSQVLGDGAKVKAFLGQLEAAGGLRYVPRSGGLRECNPPKEKKR